MSLSIHAVDVAIVLCVAIFALRGHRLGFVRDLIVFAGWGLGFALALRFMVPLARPISRWLFQPIEIAGLIAFLLLFVLGAAPFWMLLSQLSKGRRERSKPRPVERVAGVLTGTVQGVTLAAFLLFIGRGSMLVPELGPKIDAAPLGSRMAEVGKQAIEKIRSVGKAPAATRAERPSA
jgi:uncharacterized membrane protein required for colicin V production